MKRIFEACRYHNKPAIFDTVARVYYFGFTSMKQARARANELNQFMDKEERK